MDTQGTYPFSDHNDEAIAAYDSDCRQLLQDGVKGGRVLWLKGITITETGGGNGTLLLYDLNSEGGSPTASLQRIAFYVPTNETTIYILPEPGLKFITGIIAGLVSAGATIAAYAVSIFGYEE